MAQQRQSSHLDGMQSDRDMRPAQLSRERLTWSRHATPDDFQALFASEMVDLFRLALLITADAEKAERCVILTMRRCMATCGIPTSCLSLWTRDVLIRTGVSLVTGSPDGAQGYNHPRHRFAGPRDLRQSAMLASDDSSEILLLGNLERLVYVICVLERYSNRECALLLGQSRQAIREARRRALETIAAFEQKWRGISNRTPTVSRICGREGCCAELDCSCGGLLA